MRDLELIVWRVRTTQNRENTVFGFEESFVCIHHSYKIELSAVKCVCVLCRELFDFLLANTSPV